MKRTVELMGVKVIICDDVYEPHDDTELILRTVIESERELKGKTILEIGAGTGIISIILAKKGARVTAIDISEKAVACIKFNAKLNETKLKVFRGDLFSPVKSEKFDIIIFNPPYLPESDLDKYLSPGYRLAVIGGKKGSEIIIKFLECLEKHLKKNGRAFFIASSLSNIDEIMKKVREKELKIMLKRQARYFFETLFCYEVRV